MDRKKLDEILDGLKYRIDTNKPEQVLQQYLEGFPFLLCGFIGKVHNNVVISQLPLGSEYRPDFAFVVETSRGSKIHLIEIESPSLHIFTKSGNFSQEYNHALQQLHDWNGWCRENRHYLSHILEPLELSSSLLQVQCKLIAGRRGELTNSKRMRKYADKDRDLPKNFEITTWDGFANRVPIQQYLGYRKDEIKCVTYRDQGFFEKEITDIIYGS